MSDRDATLSDIKEAVRALVLEKNWGENGEQNPQHLAMAMTVEMAELLENFQWLTPDQVQELWKGRDPERKERVAGEMADILMYGLQLAYVLDIDVASAIETKIAQVRRRPNAYYTKKRALREEFERNLR